MDIVFECIGLAAGAASFVLMIFSIRGMRKESRSTLLTPITGIISATVITFVFILIAGVPINWLLAIPILGFGFFLGLLEGMFTRVYYRGNLLMTKRSAIYFVLWGLAYLLTLLLAQTKSSVWTAGGILAMILGLGIAYGSNLNLFFRQTLMRPTPGSISAPTSSSAARENPKPPSRPTDLPEISG